MFVEPGNDFDKEPFALNEGNWNTKLYFIYLSHYRTLPGCKLSSWAKTAGPHTAWWSFELPCCLFSLVSSWPETALNKVQLVPPAKAIGLKGTQSSDNNSHLEPAQLNELLQSLVVLYMPLKRNRNNLAAGKKSDP